MYPASDEAKIKEHDLNFLGLSMWVYVLQV